MSFLRNCQLTKKCQIAVEKAGFVIELAAFNFCNFTCKINENKNRNCRIDLIIKTILLKLLQEEIL